MRIRTIKPEFWTDSFMVGLPALARLTFISLLSVADDHGFFEDEPERIAMQVMPREDANEIEAIIDLFYQSGRLDLFVSQEGRTYYRIANWEKHQRVDKPGRSKIAREGSRKVAIPLEVRRKVAAKYKCAPGCEVPANCYYCDAEGEIKWWKLSDGRPSGWVSFARLELDHVMAEANGGSYSVDNIVLACRRCNRSKGTSDWLGFLVSRNVASIPEQLPLSRELSWEEQGTGKGTGNREQGSNQGPASGPSVVSQEPPQEPAKEPKRFQKPTPAEVEAYSQEIGYPLDGQGWCDTYEQKGWKVGKAPMKDWKAAVRTWKVNGWRLGDAGRPRKRMTWAT